jgi:hypothetical protein
MVEERDRQRGQSRADQRENEVTFPHEFDKLGNMGKGGNGLKQEDFPASHPSHCVVSNAWQLETETEAERS